MKKTTKIGIIGAGHVGSHVASSLMTQGLCDEIVLLDTDEGKARRHADDIADSVAYMPLPAKIYAGGYEALADADIVVLSACSTIFEQDRLLELDATVKVIAEIAPQLTASGFSGIVVSISNPCDVIAQYFARITGLNVVGTGTALDSARLCRRLAAMLGVSPHSVCAYELGEHGDSQIAAFSAATVCGKPLTDWMAEQPDTCGQADLYGAWRSTVAAGWDIVQGKGCTEFGIGAAAAAVIKAILHDEKAVLPCSTLLDGPYGQHGVYASVPCILGAAGVEEVIELTLSRDEAEGFAKSCAIIREHCEKL